MTDIINYLRRTIGSDNAMINRLLETMYEIQPEVKGDALQERIVKATEVYEIDTNVVTRRYTDALLLETGDHVLTESDEYIYLELYTNPHLLQEDNSFLLLETGDYLIQN